MGLTQETRWMDATAQADLVARDEVTPLELLESAIERIVQLDPAVNAVVLRWFDAAREVAADPDLPSGAFRGVPFLLKDLHLHHRGRPLTNGNAALAALLPESDHDTELVARYREAGLVIAGRTASAEWGSMPVTETDAWGATRNPWDLDRTPGGSSGGAAAAVALGMVPVAHGSDGGGSIRIPASCCGLFGLKPSQGRITLGPDASETAVGVDHVLTRTVRDSARMLDATHGPGVGDTIIAPPPTRPFADEVGADPGSLRIGLLDFVPRGDELDPELVDAVRDAATKLEALGHVVEAGHPASLDDPTIGAAYGAIRSPSVALEADRLADRLGRPLGPDDLQAFNRAQAEAGRAATATDLVAAMQRMHTFRRETTQWWADGWDLLLTPTLASLPLPIGALDPDPDDQWACLFRAGAFVPFTPAFNTTGQPAISVPLFHTDEGLPVGIQLVAAYGREDLLIRVASQLEAAHPWADRIPPDRTARPDQTA